MNSEMLFQGLAVIPNDVQAHRV